MEEQSNTLLGLMGQGGWVMWILLTFSVACVAVALERTWILRRAKSDLDPLMARLHDGLARKKSIRSALEACTASRGAVARVGRAALGRFDGPAAQLERSLERHSLSELRRLQRGLGVLSTTATVAPLLGFLGTVTGMMASFGAIWQHGTGDPGMVALGISEALTTTAAGLVVAVPAQLLYNALSSRVDQIRSDIESMANFVLEIREGAADAGRTATAGR